MPKHVYTMHVAAERKLVAWGRDSWQGHHSWAILLTNISLDVYRGKLCVGIRPQKCCGREHHHPESGMSNNPWIQVCNILSWVHFLLSVVFFSPACSSGSNLRKEKGQPVFLCGLYFYGMLLLKEHSCIAARQTRLSTRAQVCSLRVARLYSLQNIQKSP